MGNRFNLALFNIILREWERSYIIFAHENIPDEHTPCANIIIMVPWILHKFLDKILTIIRAMWTTDEYAIITFISLCIKHTTLRILPPNREKTINNVMIFP